MEIVSLTDDSHLGKVCGSLTDDWRLEGQLLALNINESFVPWYLVFLCHSDFLIIHSFGVLLLSFDSFSILFFSRYEKSAQESQQWDFGFLSVHEFLKGLAQFHQFILLSDSITEKKEDSLFFGAGSNWEVLTTLSFSTSRMARPQMISLLSKVPWEAWNRSLDKTIRRAWNNRFDSWFWQLVQRLSKLVL